MGREGESESTALEEVVLIKTQNEPKAGKEERMTREQGVWGGQRRA